MLLLLLFHLLSFLQPKLKPALKKKDKVNWKQQSLPLARIKKIMKSDEAVIAEIEREREMASQHSATSGSAPKQPSLSSSNQRFMIAGEAPILLSKACEMMVKELTVRAWRHTEKNRRRTLQKQDVHAAVAESDVYDFLIDIVPRVSLQPGKQSINYMDQNAINAAAAIAAPSAVDFHQMQYSMMVQQQQQQVQQQVQQQQVQGNETMSNQPDLQQHQMMMFMPQMQTHMPQVQSTNQQQQRSPVRDTTESAETRNIESSD